MSEPTNQADLPPEEAREKTRARMERWEATMNAEECVPVILIGYCVAGRRRGSLYMLSAKSDPDTVIGSLREMADNVEREHDWKCVKCGARMRRRMAAEMERRIGATLVGQTGVTLGPSYQQCGECEQIHVRSGETIAAAPDDEAEAVRANGVIVPIPMPPGE